MIHSTKILFLALAMFFLSCSKEDVEKDEELIDIPETYIFLRNGNSTVDFSGQTTRIKMAAELVGAFKDNNRSKEDLTAMFAHEPDAEDFEDGTLNASSKNIRSKVAASRDFFQANTTDALAVKSDFETWIQEQTSDVFQNWEADASAGNAGQIQESGGGSVRYVNKKGIELNQLFAKSLIGGLMVDQILNNYLSTSVLDEATNVEDNNQGTLADGKNHTTMEHKWDEAFGYLYGLEPDPSLPVLNADDFLNKYLSRVDGDSDYSGIAAEVFEAFKLGRAAIVAQDYDTRDAQVAIIRNHLSKVIAVRTIHYLQSGKDMLESQNYGSAFHDLSEGLGFLYSLQFTRKGDSVQPYFSRDEITGYLEIIMSDNGLWDVSSDTLDDISNEIAERFNLSVEEAAR